MRQPSAPPRCHPERRRGRRPAGPGAAKDLPAAWPLRREILRSAARRSAPAGSAQDDSRAGTGGGKTRILRQTPSAGFPCQPGGLSPGHRLPHGIPSPPIAETVGSRSRRLHVIRQSPSRRASTGSPASNTGWLTRMTPIHRPMTATGRPRRSMLVSSTRTATLDADGWESPATAGSNHPNPRR